MTQMLLQNRQNEAKNRVDKLDGSRSMGCYLSSLLIVAALSTVSWCADAQDVASPSAVTCAGPFARNSSHEKLAVAFGSTNVTFKEIANVEGDKIPASVIFPDDPTRRLTVIWMDSETRRGLSAIWIDRESQWVGAGGLRLGMRIEEVEILNKKPFKMTGFGWDYGGMVIDWQGGAMARLPGGCKTSLRFTPKAGWLGDDTVEGEQQFLSDKQGARASEAVVTHISITYPK